MIPEIQEYLKKANPDFNSGFALFCKYSKQQSLMSWIGRKRDMDMLLYELRKLESASKPRPNPDADILHIRFNRAAFQESPAAAAPAPTEPSLAGIVFRTFDDRRTRRSDLPEDLQKVYDETVGEYRVRRGYHEKMKAARTDKDRAEFRQQVLASEERIQAGWSQIDEYLSGQEQKKLTESFSESNARSYISKALKEETLSDRKRAGVRARVRALRVNGCTVSDEMIAALQEKGLL